MTYIPDVHGVGDRAANCYGPDDINRVKRITEARNKFKQLAGYDASWDELRSFACNIPGEPGHEQCGECRCCELPRFICGQRVRLPRQKRPTDSCLGHP